MSDHSRQEAQVLLAKAKAKRAVEVAIEERKDAWLIVLRC